MLTTPKPDEEKVKPSPPLSASATVSGRTASWVSPRIPALVGAAFLSAWASPTLAAGTTERINVGPHGEQADGDSFEASVSAHGRIVAFFAASDNIIPGGPSDTSAGILVRDRLTGTTVRADVSPTGGPADNFGEEPLVSRNGRTVAFVSYASNLVANTTNGLGNVFLRDLLTGATTRASLGSGGQQPDRNCQLAALSADGQVVAFTTSATNLTPLSGRFYVNLYVRDLATGTTTLETPSRRGGLANAPTFEASLSGNGRFLAFASYAHNLVRATRLGHHQNVFLRDRRKGRTVLVSATPDGGEGNGISFGPFVTDDGATVAFSSFATDLVPGGTSGQGDVFLRHVRTGATERVRFTTGDVEPDSGVFLADMTPDGRFLLVRSSAGNLVPNDTNSDNDFFLFDRVSQSLARVNVGNDGAQANSVTDDARLSADGGTVVFSSLASNLAPNDTNDHHDIFVRTLGASAARRR